MRCTTSIFAPISRAGQALPLLATLFFAQPTLHAQVAPPAVINFQGRLAMPSGNPVPDGNYNLIFNFYEAPTGNNRIGQKIINNVPVKNGTFAALLDSLPATLFNGNVWLGIVIGNDAELAPRTQIVSVPYALKSTLALTVPDGSLTASKFAANIFNPLAWLLNGNSGTNGTQFLGTTDNQPLLFKTNNDERMRILGNGNVGIGTSSPITPLHIAASANPEFRIQDTGTGGKTFHIGINSADGTLHFSESGVRDIMTLQPVTGNVGIGTATPVAPLSFANILGEKITLFGQSATTYGLGVQGGLLQIHGDVFGSDIAFGYGSSTAFTETMRVKGNGNVGIGTSTPAYKLDVNGTANLTGFRMATGSGLNKVLTSDASGSGAWQNALWTTDANGIKANGNVGIGMAPASNYALSVNGNVSLFADSALCVGVSLPKGQIHNSGDYYGRGYLRLHANEGDGRNGTAYIQACDDTNTSSISMIFRTKEGSNLHDVMTFIADGRTAIGGTIAGNVKLKVHDNGLTYAISADRNILADDYLNRSDARLKQHVATLPDALSSLLGLRGVTYEWNNSAHPKLAADPRKRYGFLAQEVETIFPALVQEGDNGFKAVNYIGLIPVTVEAIKALNGKIETLKKDNSDKQRQLDELRTELQALKAAIVEIKANYK